MCRQLVSRALILVVVGREWQMPLHQAILIFCRTLVRPRAWEISAKCFCVQVSGGHEELLDCWKKSGTVIPISSFLEDPVCTWFCKSRVFLCVVCDRCIVRWAVISAQRWFVWTWCAKRQLWFFYRLCTDVVLNTRIKLDLSFEKYFQVLESCVCCMCTTLMFVYTIRWVKKQDISPHFLPKHSENSKDKRFVSCSA